MEEANMPRIDARLINQEDIYEGRFEALFIIGLGGYFATAITFALLAKFGAYIWPLGLGAGLIPIALAGATVAVVVYDVVDSYKYSHWNGNNYQKNIDRYSNELVKTSQWTLIDLLNTFKSYPPSADLPEDEQLAEWFHFFFGLTNAYYGLQLLICFPFFILIDLAKNLINLAKTISNPSLFMMGMRNIVADLIAIPFLRLAVGLTAVIRGVTQIAAAPLVICIQKPLRHLWTYIRDEFGDNNRLQAPVIKRPHLEPQNRRQNEQPNNGPRPVSYNIERRPSIQAQIEGAGRVLRQGGLNDQVKASALSDVVTIVNHKFCAGLLRREPTEVSVAREASLAAAMMRTGDIDVGKEYCRLFRADPIFDTSPVPSQSLVLPSGPDALRS
jgi:hypothetical protein